MLLVGFGHVGNMNQAASLIELADDVRELLSRSAGQNDGHTSHPESVGLLQRPCRSRHRSRWLTCLRIAGNPRFSSARVFWFIRRSPQEDQRLRRKLDCWRVNVMSQGRTFSGTVAPWSPVGPRRMTEPAAKFSGEMSIVTEAAGIGNLDERLACVQQRPGMQRRAA